MLSELCQARTIEVLCIEDYAADRTLIQKFFSAPNRRCRLDFVFDGAGAIEYLFRRGPYVDKPTPDLILMDLNLPKVDGREVLKELKSHPDLRRIPIIVFTTSANHKDIATAYGLYANCYLIKPQDLDEFQSLMERTADFWLQAAEYTKH